MELTHNQKLIIKLLKQSKLSNTFYWTGGTLLSHFYLHHRYSLDLDFFSDISFSYNNLIPFLSLLKSSIKTTVEEHKISNRWEFILHDPEITRVEFATYNHDKQRLKPLRQYLGISVDSLEDIAANKTMAYFDRNEPKDLFDIYFLLNKGGFSVSQLLHMVEQKIGSKFSEFSFWSESSKSLKLLSVLRPLLIEQTKENQDQLLTQINTFFMEKGSEFLTEQLN